MARINSQIQVSLVKKRFSLMRNFVGKMYKCTNNSQLIEQMYLFLAQDDQIVSSTLFKNGKIVPCSINSSIENKVKMKKLNCGVNRETTFQYEKNTFFRQLDGFENYAIVLTAKDTFNEVDIEFYNSFLAQIRAFKENISEFIKNATILSELSVISVERSSIAYIKADKGYSLIFYKITGSPKILTLSLSTIKLYFSDTLIQVHRTYLVNWQLIKKVKFVSKNKYKISINNYSIPVGLSYLANIKRNFPGWFIK